MSNTRRRKPGAHRDKFGPYIRIAAVSALAKGANKKALAAFIGCSPATLSNWQKAAFNLDFWRYAGRPYVFRGCTGCKPAAAHKGRRAAICLLCNGANYADIAKLSGLNYRTLIRYVQEAPQCTPPKQEAAGPQPGGPATLNGETPLQEAATAAELARETLRGVIDDFATLAAELSETAAPDYLRPELDKMLQEAAALLSIVE